MTLSTSLPKMQLQSRQNDFKSEYLFRTSADATDLLMSLNSPFQPAVLQCCVVLAIYGTVPYSLISFFSAALLGAVLQASMGAFRNVMVKMKDHFLELNYGLRTSLVPVQNVCKRSAVK